MRLLRATFRLFGLCGITGSYYVWWLLGAVFVRVFRGQAREWRNRNFHAWARGCARIMALSINAQNVPPEGAFVLVSNHLSYVDVIVLASQLDCAFIAKSEVARWPILGFLCRAPDTIFIDRSNKRDLLRAMSATETTLERGLGVVLFAEGTSTGGRMAPFKSSLLEFAARRCVPVHYASIAYIVPEGERPAEHSVCWWGAMTFPSHVFRLLQLPDFQATLTFGEHPILSRDRRVLAARLWSAIDAQLKPAGAEQT